MELNELYRRIYKIHHNNIEKFDEAAILASLMEEVGEYARALSSEIFSSDKQISEPSIIEAVDIFLITLHIFISQGNSFNSILEIADKKLSKWENQYASERTQS